MRLLNPRVPRSTVPTRTLQALVLDWAGTIVDYGSLAPVRTLQQVFAGVNISVSEPEIRRDMGLAKRDHLRRILLTDSVTEAWKARSGRVPDDADLEGLYREFVSRQVACLLEYSTIIPGVLAAVARFRMRGLKIGSTTGYTREMLDLLVDSSRKAGYLPDVTVAPSEVGAGRPYPYMIYENAVRLQVYPLATIAKVGDTPADIHEGLNAGVWSIGVAATGNLMGVSSEEFQALPVATQDARLAQAQAELVRAGAHYVVNSVTELDPVLDDIDARLQSAEGPQ